MFQKFNKSQTPNQDVRMISEGPSDTEDWNNAANLAFPSKAENIFNILIFLEYFIFTVFLIK